MQFNSVTFLLFFGLVLSVFYLARGDSVRKTLLLISSYLFYAAWNPPFVLLLFLSTLVDWYLANRIAASGRPRVRRLWLLLSLCSNFGVLGYFKYGGFLLENFTALMQTAGVNYVPPEWSIVLPAGISFYTFQSLSYTIDIYRRKLGPSKSFLDFAFFISFFPQLVAGPIVRAGDFLPQCARINGATRDQFGWGIFLLLFGLFAKVVLADALLAPFVDTFYTSASERGALEAVLALLAFSAQIFYDFSAYSTCAIGVALCFGFVLPDNFRAPYAAVGFADFWRRWHISLSTWLRDYLYIPLGGNRHGKYRTATNLMLTMVIGGVWHGASWQFLIWGAVHGALLVIERVIQRYFAGFRAVTANWFKIVLALVTFCVVSLVWVFFRAPDLASTMEVFAALSREGKPNVLLTESMPYVVGLVAVMLCWQWATRTRSLEEHFQRLDWRLRSIAAAAALLVFAFVDLGNEHAFIYFQF
jgi:D-alanyl-lipoteichoic acid acyltransferase DltB (MBOAT superfamily)